MITRKLADILADRPESHRAAAIIGEIQVYIGTSTDLWIRELEEKAIEFERLIQNVGADLSDAIETWRNEGGIMTDEERFELIEKPFEDHLLPVMDAKRLKMLES